MICEAMFQTSSIILTSGYKENQVSEQDKMNCLLWDLHFSLVWLGWEFNSSIHFTFQWCLKYQNHSCSGRCWKRNLIIRQPCLWYLESIHNFSRMRKHGPCHPNKIIWLRSYKLSSGPISETLLYRPIQYSCHFKYETKILYQVSVTLN